MFDEAGIRAAIGRARAAIARSYPGDTVVCYAAKAYCAPWLLQLVHSEGLGLDVVSGGELHAASTSGFSSDRIVFHGNNKSDDELALAVELGVGRVVLDNLDEIEVLGRLAASHGRRQPVLLRVAPSVDAATHAHLHTGGKGTKFGLDLDSGEAEKAVRMALAEPGLDVRGVHAHVGSQLNTVEPYRLAIDRLFGLAARLQERTTFVLREICPGGGFGVRYTADDPAVDVAALIERVGTIVHEVACRYGYSSRLPTLSIEPGRSIIARQAIALYSVGTVKPDRGGRTVVAVDGGMGDNIRAAAYGARYTAIIADRVEATPDTDVAVVGRYCESGDVLVDRVALSDPRRGDTLAVPMAGAYQLSMASNYNLVPRPAVVAVRDGAARLVRRRETFADLLAAELVSPPAGANRADAGCPRPVNSLSPRV